jgi:hypothetical protein
MLYSSSLCINNTAKVYGCILMLDFRVRFKANIESSFWGKWFKYKTYGGGLSMISKG